MNYDRVCLVTWKSGHFAAEGGVSARVSSIRLAGGGI